MSGDAQAQLDAASAAWREEQKRAEKAWTKRRADIDRSEGRPATADLALSHAQRDLDVAKRARTEGARALEKERDAEIARAKARYSAGVAALEGEVRKARDRVESASEAVERAEEDRKRRVRDRCAAERPGFFEKAEQLRAEADALAKRVLDSEGRL